MENGTVPLVPDSVVLTLSLGVGIVSTVTNLLIFASIVKYVALREDKEYALLAALGLADSLNMMGFISMSIFRLASSDAALYSAMFRPARECLFQPHVLLFVFGWPLSNLMLLIISCDRLALVSRPLYYIQHQSHKHTKRVVVAAFVWASIRAFVVVLYVLTEIEDSEPQLCLALALIYEAKGVYSLFVSYYKSSPQYFAYVSVLVYCIVWPVDWRVRRKILPSDGDEERKKKIKAQRKMTKTLAISCFCTLLLYILPSEVALLYTDALGHTNSISHLLWVVTQTNSCANIVIYQLRHVELRTALKGLLQGKALPTNIDLWPTG